MSNLKKLLYFSVVFFVLAIVLNFRFLYMAGGDQSMYLRPYFLLKQVQSSWDENLNYALGGRTFSADILVPFYAFFKLFSFLPPVISEYIYFLAVFLGIFWSSFYFFYKYIFKDKVVSVYSSLFYVFNMFFFANFVNYNIHLSLIFLPLSLVLVHSILEGNFRRGLLFALLASLVLPSIFTNAPAALPSIVVALMYFIYLLVSKQYQISIKRLLVFIIFFIILLVSLNIWWVLPYLRSMGAYGGVVRSLGGMFNTQSIRELFRTSGGWSFDLYYLNFKEGRFDSLYVSNPIFLLATYVPVIFAFASFFFRKKNRNILFFFFLSLLGLFLAKGNLPPFGNLYYLAFRKVYLFSMFREPYTKFAIIYIISAAVLFGYFVLYFSSLLSEKRKKAFYYVLSVFMIAISLPFFIGGFVPGRFQSGPIKSYLVKVPSYSEEYASSSLSERNLFRVLSSPDAYGSRSYNWESGFSAGDSALRFFSSHPVLTYRLEFIVPSIDNTIKNVYFSMRYNSLSFINYLRVLNIKDVVQENDLDWRWTISPSYKSPSAMEKLFSGYLVAGYFSEIKNYGEFNRERLKKIPNNISDYFPQTVILSSKEKEVYEEMLYDELEGRFALNSYEVNKDFFLPLFYVPKRLEYLPNVGISMPYALTFADPKDTYAYYSDSRVIPDSEKSLIAGERKYKRVSLNTFSWNRGWAWPNVSVNPNDFLKYTAVGVRESIELLFARTLMDKVDVHLWLASKAIAEMDMFPLSGVKTDAIVQNKYLLHINKAIDLLSLVDEKSRDEEYWAMVTKVFRYMTRSKDIYKNVLEGESLTSADKVYTRFYQWISDNGYPMCENYCYELDVTEAGTYKLFVDKKEINRFTGLEDRWYDKIGITDLVNKDKISLNTVSYNAGNNDWFELGDLTVKIGKYLVNINLPPPENHISSEWENAARIKMADSGVDISTQSYFLDRENIAFASVNKLIDWKSAQKYKISFDYDIKDNDIEIAIVEDLSDPTSKNAGTYKKVIFKGGVWDQGFINYGDCEKDACYHYEKELESSMDAKGAYLYIFDRDRESFFSDLKIRNLEIVDVYEPEVIIRRELEGKPIPQENIPRITFTKLSPSRYKVKVENAGFPYYLVFGQAFNKGWKLFLNNKNLQKDADSSLITASYLDGSIKEGSHSDNILDFNIFETSEMKNISNNNHFMVNGYANSWLISPNEVDNKKDYELVVEFAPQREFIISILVSSIVAFASLLCILGLFFKLKVKKNVY